MTVAPAIAPTLAPLSAAAPDGLRPRTYKGSGSALPTSRKAFALGSPPVSPPHWERPRLFGLSLTQRVGGVAPGVRVVSDSTRLVTASLFECAAVLDGGKGPLRRLRRP